MRQSECRRYVVKEVTSSPGRTGTLWAVGCTHLASAEALFERKVQESIADGMEGSSAFLLIDRLEKKVLKSVGSRNPIKTARYFGDDVTG
jgi:hypothetical protein